jgi:hypothetical protein
VAVHHDDDGWRVTIVDRGGRDVSVRACGDEVEARAYASTVRQHVEWLSEPKFREYYRIADGGSRDGGDGGLKEPAERASDGPPGEGEG